MTTLTSADYQQKIRALIDNLKGICATYGLGNDGNEFKIITQVFLYKFLHDKFAYEVKQTDPTIAAAAKWEQALRALTPEDYELLAMTLPPGTAAFQPEQFIAALFDRQGEGNFSQLFDETLRNIASQNNEVFAVKTEGGAKIPLFERVSQYISDPGQRDNFCRAMILKRFDFVVSNPLFKMNFSDFRGKLESDPYRRFFAGIPKIPNKKKDSMAIYTCFLQHIMASLNDKGKAAVVVPTGFITAQSGIDRQIRERLVADRMLAGVVSMPSNIFATTGTNVSILFMDRCNDGRVVLIDASGLGTKVKEGKNQKTLLSEDEENRIIEVFNARQAVADFSVVVDYGEIAAKNYSLSAGQYFEVKIDYVEMSPGIIPVCH